MASHNQHFVPRCYLKPFTLGGDGFAINLYNIDRHTSIEAAPVRGQCSRSYFYGKDLRLEKLFQQSKSLYADTIRRVSVPGYAIEEQDKIVLRHFCLLQFSRTEAAAERTALVQSDLADIAFNGNVPKDLRASVKAVVQMSMRTFAETAHEINDLKVVLVRNMTDDEIITSDNPAILTNRWHLQNDMAKHKSYGIGNSGALFFLPITTKIICVIYDGDVYSMPHDYGWIDVHKTSDIALFNQHQVLDCAANIYFCDWSQATKIDELCANVEFLRPTVRHEIITSVLEQEDNWGQKFRVVDRKDIGKYIENHSEILLHVKGNRPRPGHWPSVIKWREKKRVYSNGSGVGFVRRSQVEEGRGYKNIY